MGCEISVFNVLTEGYEEKNTELYPSSIMGKE